jgi:hypothetical protein
MTRLPVPSTTRTLEIAQLEDLNSRLTTGHHRVRVTAADLGLAGAPLSTSAAASNPSSLPGTAILVRVCWDGPPEYPYIHGHFNAADGTQESGVADLHTQALERLSHQLHARQRWGT